MKKIFLALAIMPLLIVACSSDDVDTSTKDFAHDIKLLYGEWRATGVEVGGATIDLTKTNTELSVAPTYITFGSDGSFVSEGVLGDGIGTYGTNKTTIRTSIGSKKVNFEMTSLKAKTAKIKLDSKVFNLDLIPEGTGMVTVILTKDYPRTIDFEYDVKLLYGEWHATSMEGVYDDPIDLTNKVIEKIYKPTYLTFKEKGVFTSKGFLGEGNGRYVTEGTTIYTLIGEKELEFEMTELEKGSARVKLKTKDVNVNDDDLKAVEEVTVVLTK